MASYPFIYNGVNLSNLVRVRAVETTVLPPRENHAITIWEKPGSIYNSYRYGERDIVVTFLIRATQQEYNSNRNIMENKLNTLRNVFKVTEPKPLYLGDTSKYIYAVPEGDFKMTELRYDCYECEIQFVCHNPEYYSSSVNASTNRASSAYGMRNSSNNNNTIDVYNGGNASAYPIININVNENTSFLQVDNTTTGQRMLLGSYPKVGVTSSPESRLLFNDIMNDYGDWTNGAKYIDSNRGYLGKVTNTSDGSGIMIWEPSSNSTLWNGIGAQQIINENPYNFEVKANIHFNSYGVNGDPTVPQYRDEGAEYKGYKKYYYKVVAPSVPIKAEPDTNYVKGAIIGSYNKGDEVHDILGISDGWIQTEEGWCEAIHFKRYITDSTETDAAMNVVALSEIELWSRPSDSPSDSILLATIDASTVLRVHRGEIYEQGGNYYKLYISYNGKVGYIDSSKVTVYDDIEANYPEEEIIVSDDNKTGICEVYGYSADGTKLFKLCLSDESQYYSFVNPTVYIGDKKVLEDTTVSSSKASTMDNDNVAYDALSENSCDWSNFYGELGIRRENNKWQAWVYKIENGVPVKKLMLKEQEISGAPTSLFAYLVIYIGTQDPNNMCGMSITNLQVNGIYGSDYMAGLNPVPFRAGDEVKIDCFNNKVYLNNKLYNNIDMNSQFIELLSGNNTLKLASEDPSMFATVLFNERYL